MLVSSCSAEASEAGLVRSNVDGKRHVVVLSKLVLIICIIIIVFFSEKNIVAYLFPLDHKPYHGGNRFDSIL